MFLSTRGFSNVPRLDDRNDFEFIVGQDRYACPSLIADFLSPRLANLRRTDPSISALDVATKDDNHNFGEFLDVGFGAPLSVNDSNSRFLAAVCAELGNSELYLMMVKEATSTVLERLCWMSSSGLDCVDEEDVSEVASTFWKVSTSDLAGLSPEILDRVLCHPNLRLTSEDILFKLICDRVQSGHASYFDLLEYVQIEFLSKDVVPRFFDLVCEHFDRFNLNQWKSVQWKILGQSRPPTSRYLQGKRLPPNSEMKGILSYLTSICGGNVHEKGEVNLTASSVHTNGGTERWEMKHLVDENIETHFCADGHGNEWICLDFKERRLAPTHYAIWSGWLPLKSWKVEGSSDGQNWTLLDKKNDNFDVKDDRSFRTFPLWSSPTVRMIRLTLTGPTHAGGYWLMLRRLELFGSIF
jgi:hypothetical protein